LAAFVAIVIVVAAALPVGTWWAYRRLQLPAARPTLLVTIFLIAYLALFSASVATGVIESHPMPGVPILLAGSLLVALMLGLSSPGRQLATRLPLAALVAFQVFRLPLELVLHTWADQGTIPPTMTWTGQNFDVVTGIVALLAAPLATRWRPAAWIANVVGILLLINVGRVAVMSSPLPFAWGVQPPLQLAMHLPYALIIPVCVGGALTGHVVLTRALLSFPRGSGVSVAGTGSAAVARGDRVHAGGHG
jgi:hypothetical protein